MVFTPVVVRAVGVLVAVAAPAAAYAQAPRLPAFRPDVTFGIVFDDNVMSTSRPTADIFMRVTPGFDLAHESPRVSLIGSARFDAERYQERTDLNTFVARQSTAFDVTWRPNSRFSLITHAGYQRTDTPLDLNVATGLVGGRQPASHVTATVALEQAFRPQSRLSLGGEYGRYDIQVGVDTETRTARTRYTERLGPRSDLYFGYRLEQRQFLPGRLIVSHIGTAGWTYRLTRTLQLTIEGGPRVADGELVPDFLVSATQTVTGETSFTASYSHLQDVAVGVAGLITVDQVTGGVTIRRSRYWEVLGSASAFRNVFPGTDTIAYSVSGSVGRYLGDAIWLVASVNRSFNDSRVAGAPIPGTQIVRNWAMVSLRVAPFRRR